MATIVQEISAWRVFKQIVFQKHHFKLLPLVAIELEKRKKDARDEESKKAKELMKSEQKEKTGGIQGMIANFVNDGLELKCAFEELNKTDGSDLSKEINTFFLEYLPKDTPNAKDKDSVPEIVKLTQILPAKGTKRLNSWYDQKIELSRENSMKNDQDNVLKGSNIGEGAILQSNDFVLSNSGQENDKGLSSKRSNIAPSGRGIQQGKFLNRIELA
jgi:hypothetical protein